MKGFGKFRNMEGVDIYSRLISHSKWAAVQCSWASLTLSKRCSKRASRDSGFPKCPQLISDNPGCTRAFLLLVEGVFPFHGFPLGIPDAHSAVTRVGFPEDPVLHGTGFLQTRRVQRGSHLAGRWHTQGSLGAAATLPASLPSGPIAARAGGSPEAVCQSLTLLPLIPGLGGDSRSFSRNDRGAPSRHSPSPSFLEHSSVSTECKGKPLFSETGTWYSI